MFKKIISCAMSALIFISGISAIPVSAEGTTSAAEETVSQYVYNNQLTVFDFIKSKREVLINDTEEIRANFEFIRNYLVRKCSASGSMFAKKFVIEFDTEGCSTEKYSDPSILDSSIIYEGDVINIPAHLLSKEGCSHGGWQYNGVIYKQKEKFTMPDENVVFTPYWFVYHMITYYAGDYDDVVEYPSLSVQGTEGVGMELAASTRFTRPGYNLVGWMCDYDGLDYGPNARFIVPDKDVKFTAIWEKAEVILSVSAKNDANDGYTETLYAGDEYVLPECTFTNGTKTFRGWSYNGVIYQPGDTITVPSLLPGQKMVIVARWKD